MLQKTRTREWALTTSATPCSGDRTFVTNHNAFLQMGEAMYKGSCLCGSVTYEVRGDLNTVTYCHCTRCRKASGSAFAANATVAESAFEFVTGRSGLGTYSTAAGVHRMFCSTCGSPLISWRDALPNVLRLRLGTLDTPISERPMGHYFVASKADWHEVQDTLPQHLDRLVT